MSISKRNECEGEKLVSNLWGMFHVVFWEMFLRTMELDAVAKQGEFHFLVREPTINMGRMASRTVDLRQKFRLRASYRVFGLKLLVGHYFACPEVAVSPLKEISAWPCGALVASIHVVKETL